MMETVYCSECGKNNDIKNIFCENCNSTLKTNNIKKGNQINSFEELITPENLKILKKTEFSSEAYKTILEEIVHMGYEKFNYDNNLSVLDNVYNLAQTYSTIYYKHKFNHALGYHIANEIYLDEKLCVAQKISTLIHEFTHHLYDEIFEQWLMYVFKVEKTVYLEGFAFFTNDPPLLHLLNEYIAHTTQEQFIMPNGQCYSSYREIINDSSIDINKYKWLLPMGRSVSKDIEYILEHFIDNEIKEKIIQEFSIANIKPFNDPLISELKNIKPMSEEKKLYYFKLILVESFEECLNDKNAMERMKELSEYF